MSPMCSLNYTDVCVISHWLFALLVPLISFPLPDAMGLMNLTTPAPERSVSKIFLHTCGVRVVFLEHGVLAYFQVVSLHLKS